MVQKSVDLFLKEMDEAGVDKGILVGKAGRTLFFLCNAMVRVHVNPAMVSFKNERSSGNFPLLCKIQTLSKPWNALTPWFEYSGLTVAKISDCVMVGVDIYQNNDGAWEKVAIRF